MKFIAAAALFLATAVVALPGYGGWRHGHGNIDWPIHDNAMTVAQAQNKCGNNVLSCCNKRSEYGPTSTYNSGLLSGGLEGLLASGSGAQGLGLFDQCSKLDLNAVVNVIGILPVGASDLVQDQCKGNVVCCNGDTNRQTGGLVQANLPCVALGSLL